MIIKLLGIIDILAAILFWIFGMFHIIPSSIIMIIAFFLLVKGIIFVISMDVASIIDIIISILMFVSINFALPKFVVFLIAIFLLQKGILSLL